MVRGLAMLWVYHVLRLKANPNIVGLDSFKFYHIIHDPIECISQEILDGIRRIECGNPYHYEYQHEYEQTRNYFNLYLQESSQRFLYIIKEERLKCDIIELSSNINRLYIELEETNKKILRCKKTLYDYNIISKHYKNKLMSEFKCCELVKHGPYKGFHCCKKVCVGDKFCSRHKKK